MKYDIGNRQITLTDKNFLSQGGEGSIYVNGGIAYKIYHDPAKMIPLGKIQELSAISDNNVIKPLEVISLKNNPVGYSMSYVTNTYSLVQVFPKVFRDRNKLSHQTMLNLIKNLQDLVQNIHSKKVLIVDLNEMNFLVSNKFDNVYAIDVDSYQTEHFKATAIMESIRDRHSKTFSEMTDWFSFGVVSFQMFIGIHPYKGKHPHIKDWNERMEKNISVFNKDVSIPAVCYPISVIPQAYRDWYKAVFEDGKRVPPPSALQAAAVVLVPTAKVLDSRTLDITEIGKYVGQIINVKYRGGLAVIQTADGLQINKSFDDTVTYDSRVVITPKCNVITARIDCDRLKLYNALTRKEIPIVLNASDVTEYDNRFYVKNSTSIVEIQLNELAGSIIPSFNVVGQVLENSSMCFDGVVIQNLVGAYYASIFAKPGACYQVRLPELAGYKILSAKFDKNILMVMTAANATGKKDVFIYKFAEENNYSAYTLDKIDDVPAYYALNFVVLDSGVCVSINDKDEQIEVFTAKSTIKKLVKDDAVDGSMRLYKDGARLLFSDANQLYAAKLK